MLFRFILILLFMIDCLHRFCCLHSPSDSHWSLLYRFINWSNVDMFVDCWLIWILCFETSFSIVEASSTRNVDVFFSWIHLLGYVYSLLSMREHHVVSLLICTHSCVNNRSAHFAECNNVALVFLCLSYRWSAQNGAK